MAMLDWTCTDMGLDGTAKALQEVLPDSKYTLLLRHVDL